MVFERLDILDRALNRLYDRVESLQKEDVTDSGVRAFNDTILELGRILIPINYTREGRFRNEPAVPVPPLPDLAPAGDLSEASDHEKRVIRTHLQRGLNRVGYAFERAAAVIDSAFP